MKRFYKTAKRTEVNGDFGIALDDSPIKTPSQNTLVSSSGELVDMIVSEWNNQGDDINPKTMPISQLLNTKIDHVDQSGIRTRLRDETLRFVDSDLIFYYAERPDDLVAQQENLWRPQQKWFEQEYGISIKTTQGIGYVDQDPSLVKNASDILDGLSSYRFTAFQSVVGPLGSFVIALAFVTGEIDAQKAYDSAFVDEIYQADQWGTDKDAEKNRKNILKELQTVKAFLNAIS